MSDTEETRPENSGEDPELGKEITLEIQDGVLGATSDFTIDHSEEN